MDYILDYLDNLVDRKNQNLVFSSFQNVQLQDPLSKLLKWLNTEKRTAIRIKSEEDILVDDFLYTNNNQIIELNLDKKEAISTGQLSIFKTNRRNPDFPTEQQKSILTELKKVPVYTVVNGNNEIILASPREDGNSNSFQWFYEQYHNWFIWKKDEGPVTVGLFFSNKEDAESYLHEICLKDPRGAQNFGLSVKITGLDTFYYLNRTSSPKTQVRIISDLEELDSLLKVYIKKNINIVNPKQKYGRNWFKGTPIYILRTDDINNSNNKKEVRKTQINKKLIFFNKKDIDRVLTASKNNNKKLDVKEPNVEIYNLENYLLDLEKSSPEIIQRINFFPPYISYKDISEKNIDVGEEITANKQIKRAVNEKIKSVQRFCKGVIWLLTSDTLPSEENSW
jgi:hypothetical protein